MSEQPRPTFEAYRAAQAAMRELITLRLLDEPIGERVDDLLTELRDEPAALPAFVHLVIEATAAQWGSVEEFSAHVVAALAIDDTQGEGP